MLLRPTRPLEPQPTGVAVRTTIISTMMLMLLVLLGVSLSTHLEGVGSTATEASPVTLSMSSSETADVAYVIAAGDSTPASPRDQVADTCPAFTSAAENLLPLDTPLPAFRDTPVASLRNLAAACGPSTAQRPVTSLTPSDGTILRI
ncbi:hypothetical protein [Microbacterium halotolerans]|uniref:hypothetical protein n=1 Tax=Microbacterium halotolerans TaxID=246613 RepID=UPI001968EE6F|nr:hypothetical protein [Microbacterium halotolerans]